MPSGSRPDVVLQPADVRFPHDVSDPRALLRPPERVLDEDRQQRFAAFTSRSFVFFDAPSSRTRSYATPELWWMPSSIVSRLQRSSSTVPRDERAISRNRG